MRPKPVVAGSGREDDEHRRFVEALDAGYASVQAGRVVSRGDVTRRIDALFARQARDGTGPSER
ncbi:MAG TPA: hypothetical protein VGE72_27715 [Azospirillum sp.]